MTEIIVDTNQDNGREFRTVTASTKVTDQELAQLEIAAAARGVRLGEWIREILFREARLSADPPQADPEMVEIIGLQMFLNKHRAARDAMAQYRKQTEEEHHG